MDESTRHINPNPVTKANWLSRLFFWWLNPLFKTGYERRLEVEDMYNVLSEDESTFLHNRLNVEWEKELEKVSTKGKEKKPSLLKAICRAFWKDFIVLGIILSFEEFVKIVQPLLLGQLIRYFGADSEISTAEAYGYAAGLGITAIFIGIVHHPYFYLVQRLGACIRIASCGMIYHKSLRLSYGALGESSTGQIVNLMSNDVNRFDQALIFIHFLWIGPVQAVVVLIILYMTLGPASLAGFLLLILLIPVQGSMGRVFAKLRSAVAGFTDERVRTMDEVLSGMRVIKMYCWENMFSNLITSVRADEMARVRKGNYIKASINAPFFASAKLIIYVTFLVYILTGNFITAEKIFTTYALINPVRLVLTLFVPFAVQFGSEAVVTIRRIQKFLLLEELHESTSVIRPVERPPPAQCKVVASQVAAKWKQDASRPTLQGLNFSVGAGELLAVIGPVGAGKSSLLMALLGELPLSSGTIKLQGRVAYASQQPWVFSASVRQNIVFGQRFDEKRYRRVVAAADLKKDFSLFEHGDQTLVGDRGVSLSGGQKARLSLARALYFDADIYLLDDPLSAVDAAVGRHLFDQSIMGILKDKPRILVTHQLQYLKAADKILILKQGEVMALDSYDNLCKSGIDFTALLQQDTDDDATDVDDVVIENIINNVNEGSDLISPLPQNLHAAANSHNADYLSQSFDVSYLSSKIAEEEKEGLLNAASSVDNLNHLRQRGKPSVKSAGQKATLKLQRRRDSLKLNGQANGAVLLQPNASSLIRSVENLEGNMLQGSMWSLRADEKPSGEEFERQEQAEEERAEGTVGFGVWCRYLYSGGGAFGVFMLILTNLLAQGTFMASDFWLAYWSDQEQKRIHAINKHEQLLNLGYNVTNVTIPYIPENTYIAIFTGVTASVFIFGLARALWAFRTMLLASKHLHNTMLDSVLRTPVLFFDANPIGRILNRFSKDMGLVDETLPLTLFDVMQCGLMIVGYVLTAGIINPWVFIPTAPLCVLFVIVRKYYLSTSRDIKRLEGTTRSPVYSHLSATLHGLHTIRAYQVSPVFETEFHGHQNLHTESWYLFLTTSRWFAIRLDLLCAFFIAAVALCCVPARATLDGGLVGLTLTYAMGLIGLFQWGVRQSAEAENQMTSVERILEYARLPPEAALRTPKDRTPRETWPEYGVITGEDVSFRYNEDAPWVLHNLRFCVRAREKVGICGRTGAGKSSFITMLFRMAEPTGKILIDGVDISTLGLHDLRERLSIIPQDPVLFSGSVRKNLDPFDQHSDQQLWTALEEVQLRSAVDELGGGLDAPITEGGKNFSVGQRQLVCLARAILRHNNILVIDEATANVDHETDALIQQTIRDKFADCTVLTIAHRLNTIMDSDRVMVLEAGRIVEFDEPYLLLASGEGVFHNIVAQTGAAEAGRLMDTARSVYRNRHPDEDLDERDERTEGPHNVDRPEGIEPHNGLGMGHSAKDTVETVDIKVTPESPPEMSATSVVQDATEIPPESLSSIVPETSVDIPETTETTTSSNTTDTTDVPPK